MRLLPSLLAVSLCVGGIAHLSKAAAQEGEPRCQIILFGKKNFEPGTSGFRIIFTDVPDLTRHDFNNKTSSVVVVKGPWRLYPRKDYQGDRSRRLRPGVYPNVEELRVGNNEVSSLRCRDDD